MPLAPFAVSRLPLPPPATADGIYDLALLCPERRTNQATQDTVACVWLLTRRICAYDSAMSLPVSVVCSFSSLGVPSSPDTMCLPDSPRSAQHPRGPPVSLRMKRAHSLLWLSRISLDMCATSSLSAGGHPDCLGIWAIVKDAATDIWMHRPFKV